MIRLYSLLLERTSNMPARTRENSQPAWPLVLGLSFTGLSIGFSGPVQAQNAIQALSPAANALHVSRSNGIAVTFDQAVTGSSPADAIHVFGSQTDLRTGGVYQGSNTNTFSFDPAADLHPGEQAWVTVAAPGGAGYAPYAYQFTAATARASANFSAPLQLAANAGTNSIATADINGDGSLDLATLSETGISVFLANPAQPASFGAAIPIAFGDTPQSIALADIDGDGKLDLLVTSGTTSSIVVGLNTGSTTAPFFFDAASARVPVTGVLSLLSADFDRSGQLDLATLNALDQSISVRFNSNGTATPSAATNIQLSATPVSIVAADMNTDGIIDLVTVNDDGTLSVLPNDVTGLFAGVTASSVSVANGPTRVIAADVDEDGDLDLVTANLDNTITILRNVGGGFLPANAISIPVVEAINNNGPMDVKAADVDGDGDLDLVTANFFDSVSILRNAGGGAFPGDYSQPGVSQLSVDSPLQLATADLNRDGALDLVTMNASTVTGLLNAPEPLPVSLLDFSAARHDDQVLLTWKTASELQNMGFEVQATSDLRDGFKKVTFVPSQGSNSNRELAYSFLEQPSGTAGMRYYRLRQIDQNGQFSYSPVKAIRLPTAQARLEAYPNPFSGQVQVKLAGLPVAPGRLTLRNALGQPVLTQQYAATDASVLTLTTPATLPPGTYLLELEVAGKRFYQRLTK